MQQFGTTICALATPPGEGSIATVRLSGPQALTIATAVFEPLHKVPPLQKMRGYTARFGHYRLRGQRMDETILLVFRAPHSYTGEDVAEFSVHGGSAMAQGLLEALLTAGAQPAAPGEFTRRALENGRMSLTQAEAVMAVISAEGRQGAALAKGVLDGALAHEISDISEDLKSLAAHFTAWVDYPEEDVPELSPQTIKQTLERNKLKLDALIDGYGAGRVLRRGVDCVLLGRPNVGKSTLLNLLAGFERAIVTPVAGTTRDVVEQAVVLGDTGIRLNLFDTAGVREQGETGDAIEAEGIRRSWKKVEEAGLILAVFDSAQPLSTEDMALAEKCRGRPAIALLNKTDLAQQTAPMFHVEQFKSYFAAVVPVCAKDPASREPLCRAVAEVLGTAKLNPDAASLCSERQLAAAVAARDALAQAIASQNDGFGPDAAGVCLDDALHALAQLSGEDVTESVLDEVFSRFCVGK